MVAARFHPGRDTRPPGSASETLRDAPSVLSQGQTVPAQASRFTHLCHTILSVFLHRPSQARSRSQLPWRRQQRPGLCPWAVCGVLAEKTLEVPDPQTGPSSADSEFAF